MKKCVLALFILLKMLPCLSQSGRSEDVIYLKNQWVVRGRIIDQNDSSLRIQSGEGNIYFFSKSEIDKITHENAWRSFMYKKKGFANFTELGPLVAGKTTIEGVTTAAFSFQTVNGYKFGQFAMAGIGVGADLYATQTLIPVFASFRGDLSSKGSVIPFYFGDLGYGVNITQNSSAGESFKGGLMYAAGLGIKIPFNRTAGFLLSAGYRYQKTSYTVAGFNSEVTYSRLAIRAGFFL